MKSFLKIGVLAAVAMFGLSATAQITFTPAGATAPTTTNGILVKAVATTLTTPVATKAAAPVVTTPVNVVATPVVSPVLVPRGDNGVGCVDKTVTCGYSGAPVVAGAASAPALNCQYTAAGCGLTSAPTPTALAPVSTPTTSPVKPTSVTNVVNGSWMGTALVAPTAPPGYTAICVSAKDGVPCQWSLVPVASGGLISATPTSTTVSPLPVRDGYTAICSQNGTSCDWVYFPTASIKALAPVNDPILVIALAGGGVITETPTTSTTAPPGLLTEPAPKVGYTTTCVRYTAADGSSACDWRFDLIAPTPVSTVVPPVGIAQPVPVAPTVVPTTPTMSPPATTNVTPIQTLTSSGSGGTPTLSPVAPDAPVVDPLHTTSSTVLPVAPTPVNAAPAPAGLLTEPTPRPGFRTICVRYTANTGASACDWKFIPLEPVAPVAGPVTAPTILPIAQLVPVSPTTSPVYPTSTSDPKAGLTTPVAAPAALASAASAAHHHSNRYAVVEPKPRKGFRTTCVRYTTNDGATACDWRFDPIPNIEPLIDPYILPETK